MNKNIAFFTAYLKVWGWIETWAFNLWKKLEKEWYNVKFLTIYDEKNNKLVDKNYFSINENINHYKKYNIPKRIYHIIYRSYFLKKFCKDNNIELLISASTIPNLSALISKIFLNKTRIITTVHNSFFLKSVFEKLVIYLQKYSNKIIFVSKEAENIINKKLKTKNTLTIYNGISFKDNTRLSFKKNNIKKFISIWRLDENKNHKLLLDIFNEYYKINNNTTLTILWDWILKNELNNYKNTLVSKNNIFFLWLKKNVSKYLLKSDYLLMTSKLEWFPMVFIEAMNYWLPIITNDFKTWAKELIRWIDNNNFKDCIDIEITERWILVPYNNVEKFIESLLKLDNINFDNKYIKDYSNKNFNIDNNINKWIEIIEKK